MEPPPPLKSASHRTLEGAEAENKPRIRQSVLYSDHPKRSQRRRGQVQSHAKSPVEKNASEVSSSELGTTTADMPKFKALTINDSLPRLDSTERSEESTYVAGSNQGSSKFSEDKPRYDSEDETLEGAEAENKPHIRQSVLYSDRPKRSQRRRGQVQSHAKSPVEKNASEVSSSELGTTTADMPKFKALTINDSLSRLDSTERSEESTYDAGSNQGSSKFSEDKPRYDSEDEEECLRKLREYFSKKPIHTSVRAAREAVVARERAALTSLALKCGMEPPPDPFRRRKSSLVDREAQTLQAPQQTSDAAQHSLTPHKKEPSQQILPIRQPRSEVSIEIAENGKKWMSEEVMVAFKKYIEGKADLAGHDYCLELHHQCFNVENYFQNFHHYNFNVKMKKHNSADGWAETMYFAEVKMIFRRKYYFCCPLEPLENGHCYACRNQGMDDLRHPATGGFEMGSPDTVFPYMYTSD